MKKEIIGMVLQIPLVLIVIISFFASIYAIVRGIYPISGFTPIILGVIILSILLEVI